MRCHGRTGPGRRRSEREIERLLEWGADFEKRGNALALSREGGHSSARIVHGNGGLTGTVVVDAQLARAQAYSNISIAPFSFLGDLIVHGNRVVGVDIPAEHLSPQISPRLHDVFAVWPQYDSHESRGAHYRDDFPEPADLALHSYLKKDQHVVLR